MKSALLTSRGHRSSIPSSSSSSSCRSCRGSHWHCNSSASSRGTRRGRSRSRRGYARRRGGRYTGRCTRVQRNPRAAPSPLFFVRKRTGTLCIRCSRHGCALLSLAGPRFFSTAEKMASRLATPFLTRGSSSRHASPSEPGLLVAHPPFFPARTAAKKKEKERKHAPLPTCWCSRRRCHPRQGHSSATTTRHRATKKRITQLFFDISRLLHCPVL